MTQPNSTKTTPGKILVATDLSARCDRAVDRALVLAQRWQARLVFVHVIEDGGSVLEGQPIPSWRHPPDPLAIARRHLMSDLGPLAESATVIIERGRPADAIRRVAEAEGCDLVIVGLARDELLGRFRLGTTVDRLLRGLRIPLLVVKERARDAYQRIVVATDFSESSRHALEVAARFFAGQRLTLFHAFDPPLAALVGDPSAYRSQCRAVAAEASADFIKLTNKPDQGWIEPKLVVDEGDPDVLLRSYVDDMGSDLVVLGTHGRSAFFDILLGRVATRIMDGLPCDALVVREPRARTEP